MFVLKKAPDYWWTVTYRTPSEEGGNSYSDARFEIKFRALPQEDLDRIGTAAADVSDDDFVRRIVTDWRGIGAPGGGDMAYSEAAFAELLALPGMRACIILAYRESIAGRLRKN